MDSLVSKKSIDDFYTNTIMPLVLYGCGSVNDLLELKVYDLRKLEMAVKDKDFQKQFLALHGLQPN